MSRSCRTPHRLRRPAALLALASAMLAAAPVATPAQTSAQAQTQTPGQSGRPSSERPTFATQTDAVRLDLLVTRGGAPVTGLTAADFEVRDNDVPQQVRLLAQGDAPVDIILALDISSSMEGERLDRLIDGVRTLLAELRPGDRLAMLTFSHRARLPVPLTADTATIRTLLLQVAADGLTSLNDAAYLALLSGDPGVRTVLIAFSDGEDRSSWLTPDDVVEAGKRADAVVYGVVLRPGAEEEPWRDPSIVWSKPVLDLLSRQSGGRVVTTLSAGALTGVFRGILTEFRQRYVLAFEPWPSGTPGWHALRVRIVSSRAEVSTRAGYFAAAR